MKEYKHLSLEERERFFALKEQGKSYRQIALVLGRSHTSLIREIRRNRNRNTEEYIPCKAHGRFEKRANKQRTKAPLKNVAIYCYVRDKLKEGISPELIAGRINIDYPGTKIHFETIYRYIYGKGKEFKLWQYLDRSHRKRREKTGRKTGPGKKSIRIPGAVSIEYRAQKVNKRNQIGHFETDLIEGNRKDTAVISINIERKTRHITLSKLENKKAKNKLKSMTERLKMIQSLSKHKRPLVKTVTYDNGSENVIHIDVTGQLGVLGYFCHAYHSWEKGTVENRIIQVRKYIPKGECISKYSDEQIQWIENKINDRPMKCLRFRTPNEMMEMEANKYKFRSYKKSLRTKWCTSTAN